MVSPSVKDFLLFHRIDRMAYNKFLFYCEAEAEPNDRAKKVVALFIWLEKLNVRILLRIVKITDLSTLLKVFAEAEAVLHCLQQNEPDLNIPAITSMTGNIINIGFFNCNRDLMMRNLVGILDGVGRIVFDDDMYALLRAYEEQQDDPEVILGVKRLKLPAALAKPFDDSAKVAPSTQENRSMLVGFDVSRQINGEEISEYFTKRWGDCIEQVLISNRHHTKSGETVVYGKVVFKSPTYIGLALKGDQTVKYRIELGKELCAYKYKWSYSKYL